MEMDSTNFSLLFVAYAVCISAGIALFWYYKHLSREHDTHFQKGSSGGYQAVHIPAFSSGKSMSALVPILNSVDLLEQELQPIVHFDLDIIAEKFGWKQVGTTHVPGIHPEYGHRYAYILYHDENFTSSLAPVNPLGCDLLQQRDVHDSTIIVKVRRLEHTYPQKQTHKRWFI